MENYYLDAPQWLCKIGFEKPSQVAVPAKGISLSLCIELFVRMTFLIRMGDHII